jgi:hypothetical protein
MAGRAGPSATRRPPQRRARRAPRRRSVRRKRFDVFLNVPFDRQYEPLLLALVAGLTAFGLTPRCVLEIPTQQDRLRRLLHLIEECDASVHDLSRSGSYGRAPRCARFNMPFELGLAVAQAIDGNDHAWIVLEATPYRVQKSLSDINGFDPFIHHGTAQGVLRAVADAFHRPGRSPSMLELQRVYRTQRATARELKTQDGADTLFNRRHFGQLVLVAQKTAVRLGLVR